MQKKITIIGAGSWGTAIAQHLAKNSYQVLLRVLNKKTCQEINNLHENSRYLPKISLHRNIVATLDLNPDSDFVFIAVASKDLPLVFLEISKIKFKQSCCFVICSKGLIEGISAKSLKVYLISEFFEKITGYKNHVSLLGPNFALEVANHLPTITSIASENKRLADKVIKILNSKNFLAIYHNDQKTAEICGAIKNIMAIGCGIIEGLNLGENCKAALIVKGISEIEEMCKSFNASSDIKNAAGFGDIFLTCSSSKSRNYSLGLEIAKEKNPLNNKNKSKKTYEGASAARLVIKLANSKMLKLPLCRTIVRLLDSKHSKDSIKSSIIEAIFNHEN